MSRKCYTVIISNRGRPGDIPTGYVSSWEGAQGAKRVGDVVAAEGDYTLPMITGLTDTGPGTNYLADDGTYKEVTGGGGGAVDSVFGRTGDVVAADNDYDLAQIDRLTDAGPGTNYLADDGTYKEVTGGGGGAVDSVFGRTGDVVAADNDYDLAQINRLTDAGDGTQFLANDGTYKAGTGGNPNEVVVDVVYGDGVKTELRPTIDLTDVSRLDMILDLGAGTSIPEIQYRLHDSDVEADYWAQIRVATGEQNTVENSIVQRPILLEATVSEAWERIEGTFSLFNFTVTGTDYQTAAFQGSGMRGTTNIAAGFKVLESIIVHTNRDSINATPNVLADLADFRIVKADGSTFGPYDRLAVIVYEYRLPAGLDSFVLLESDDFLLLEDGTSKLLMESST